MKQTAAAKKETIFLGMEEAVIGRDRPVVESLAGSALSRESAITR